MDWDGALSLLASVDPTKASIRQASSAGAQGWFDRPLSARLKGSCPTTGRRLCEAFDEFYLAGVVCDLGASCRGSWRQPAGSVRILGWRFFWTARWPELLPSRLGEDRGTATWRDPPVCIPLWDGRHPDLEPFEKRSVIGRLVA